MGSVSFVVTVYNKAPFLPLVIRSLWAQSGLDDAEFIFVDDGSTDGSFALLQTLTAGRPGVRLITQRNGGPSAATNRGIAEATRPWIKLVDGDDVLVPNATALLLEAATRLGTGFAYCTLGTLPDDAARERMTAAPAPAVAAVLQETPLAFMGQRMTFNPTCMLARSDLLRDAGGCDARVFIQDYSVALRMAARTPFAHLPADLAFSLPLEGLDDPARASGNQAQILHDLNLVLYHFLNDHPDLAPPLRAMLIRRALGRAWKWHRRRNGGSLLSRPFVDFVRAALPNPPAELVRRTCAVFRDTHRHDATARPVRLIPQPEETPA